MGCGDLQVVAARAGLSVSSPADAGGGALRAFHFYPWPGAGVVAAAGFRCGWGCVMAFSRMGLGVDPFTNVYKRL